MSFYDPMPSLNLIAQTLFDKKGMNILALDVKAISTLTDYVVIVEGQAPKHVQALGAAVAGAMREAGSPPLRSEGMGEGEWVVLDFSFVVVHLFEPGMREKYQLEELWRQAEIVDVHIELSKEMRSSL